MYNPEAKEIYTFYRQGQTFIVNEADIGKYEFDP